MAGTLNGLMISKLNLQPFIVTLASTTCLRGLALVYTGGYPIYELPEEFIKIFAGKVGNIPIMVFWAFVCTVICVFIMRKTRFGEYVLAIGGNEEAARICGVNTGKIKLIVYGMSGLMSTIGALMLAARLNAAEPSSGVSYELNAIAAVVMGGASLSGGKANMLGTVIGALILSMLANGLTLLNIQSYYQQVVTGIVIIVAVILDKRRV
jgi:ribose/xylose/arabinose/galactoside ABC-type transport system permease subunit